VLNSFNKSVSFSVPHGVSTALGDQLLAADTAASCYITLMTIVLNTDQDTLECNKHLETLSRPQNVIKNHIKLTKQTDINYVLRGALGRDKKWVPNFGNTNLKIRNLEGPGAHGNIILVVGRITTFRSKTDRIYDGVPIRF
jgi:hypothetical protein